MKTTSIWDSVHALGCTCSTESLEASAGLHHTDCPLGIQEWEDHKEACKQSKNLLPASQIEEVEGL